jgi:hypothetical protein
MAKCRVMVGLDRALVSDRSSANVRFVVTIWARVWMGCSRVKVRT